MRSSVLAKVLFCGFLILVLLIPIGMVRSVVDERQRRRDDVIKEVSGKWGSAQTLLGPVLTIPYHSYFRDEKNVVRMKIEKAQLLPDVLKMDGSVAPDLRKRGIFEVVLYGLDLDVSGTMPAVDVAALGIPADELLWDEAQLSVGIPDTRGIKEQLRLSWDGADLPFRPGLGSDPLGGPGIHAPLPGLKAGGSPHAFSFHLTLKGSQSLNVVPSGVETRVKLRSTWPNPSFNGAFLPETRTVGPQGFAAEWRVSYFGRSTPQQWKTESVDPASLKCGMNASSFGVLLFRPADFYQQSTRAIKYAILFVALTFGAFFLFEVFSGLRLHPLQYLLVGFALALFYLLLVSLAEHLGFARAYAASAGATVALIGAYAARILQKRRRAVLVSTLLAALYGYLFVLLRLEDDALLLGTVALFAILSAAMFLTRNVDWWTVSAVPPVPPVMPREAA